MSETSGKLSESVYREFVLSDASISQALDFNCSAVRNACQCPNKKLCKDLFLRSAGPIVIKGLRERFFETNGNVSTRRDNFCKCLSLLTTLNLDGTRKIVYSLNNEIVCKVNHAKNHRTLFISAQ